MIENEKENLSAVQKILVDAGYTGEKFASKIKTIINANVEGHLPLATCHLPLSPFY